MMCPGSCGHVKYSVCCVELCSKELMFFLCCILNFKISGTRKHLAVLDYSHELIVVGCSVVLVKETPRFITVVVLGYKWVAAVLE